MISGPKYKICRRLGSAIFEKCQTQKFVVSEGRHANKKRGKKPKAPSAFGLQLIEKQKIRFSYGVSEKQFSNYVKAAMEKKGAGAAESLFDRLENRLDNVIYRLGIANTRALARQMVSHGHITVNGVRTRVPSYAVRVNDVVAIREGSKARTLFSDTAKRLEKYNYPAWLSFDVKSLQGVVTGRPKNTEGNFDINTVLEFYSR